MDNKKAPSPFAVLWGWASGEHGGFYASVALAVLGVACGMAPYFCVAAMIGLLLEGGGLAECLPWCGLALAGYAGKALFSTWSTSLSHTATYHTLRRVRQNLLSKLSRVPMGTILDTPSGQYKTTIVDRVEGMEPTLAHLLPEDAEAQNRMIQGLVDSLCSLEDVTQVQLMLDGEYQLMLGSVPISRPILPTGGVQPTAE